MFSVVIPSSSKNHLIWNVKKFLQLYCSVEKWFVCLHTSEMTNVQLHESIFYEFIKLGLFHWVINANWEDFVVWTFEYNLMQIEHSISNHAWDQLSWVTWDKLIQLHDMCFSFYFIWSLVSKYERRYIDEN